MPNLRISAAVLATVALTLVTTALQGLGVPTWVWVSTLVIAFAALGLALAGLPAVQRRLPWLVKMPLVDDPVGDTVRRLDDVCVYLIRSRRTVEVLIERQAGNPTFVPALFSSPPSVGSGSYGPYPNHIAREGFARLQELGIIEPFAYHENGETEYRWTVFGGAVSDRVLAKHPLDESAIRRALSPSPTP